MEFLLNLLSWALLSLGGVFILIGAIGVLRLPEFYARIHASSLTDTMGTILILTGIMLQAGISLATIKLLAILVFMLMAGPTATYALANAALLSGMKPNATTLPHKEG